MEEVTARKLADAAGCSTQPIFRAYQNMEEVQAEEEREAMASDPEDMRTIFWLKMRCREIISYSMLTRKDTAGSRWNPTLLGWPMQ